MNSEAPSIGKSRMIPTCTRRKCSGSSSIVFRSSSSKALLRNFPVFFRMYLTENELPTNYYPSPVVRNFWAKWRLPTILMPAGQVRTILDFGKRWPSSAASLPPMECPRKVS